MVIFQAQAFSPDSIVETETTNTTDPSSRSLSAPLFTCRDLRMRSQRDLCYDTPGLLEILLKSEQLAKEECEFWFKDHQWKCFGFSMLTPNNVTKRGLLVIYMYLHTYICIDYINIYIHTLLGHILASLSTYVSLYVYMYIRIYVYIYV